MPDEAERRQAFTRLQPICSSLLQDRTSASTVLQHLEALKVTLEDVSDEGLRGCSEYVLFPLLLLVDSVAASRLSEGALSVPAARTDRVAEGALICCRILLSRCPVQHPELVHKLIQRLAPAAGIPREAASEEVRHAAQQCLEALFKGLGSSHPDMRAFWSSEAGVQDLAYVTQLLLEAADAEARAGHTGSKAVRTTAVATVCLVLEAVRDPAPLSYLLPGLVGGLSKALLAGAAKMTQERAAHSGAAASSAALAQAIRGMSLLLCATLADSSTPPGSAAAQGRRRDPAPAASSAEALCALEALAVSSMASAEEEAAAAEPALPAAASLSVSGQEKYLVRRDTAWVDSTLQRLVPLLQRVLPPLCSHPQHSVREALAEGVCEVMSHCAVTLAPASEMLLGIVLALAADEWPQVAEPCRAFLGRGWAGSTDADSPSQRHLLAGLISKLIPGLADAAKGNQDALILHARRLSTALQVLPAQVVAAKLLQNPAQLSLLCSSLQECFAFDPAAAGLLLYATADAGPHLSNPAAQPLSDSLDDLSSSTMVSTAPAAAVAGDTQGSGQHTGALDALWPQQGSQSAPMLPRMPAGLAHAGSQQCYEALAAVARSIGRVAYQSGGSVLRSLVDALLSQLRKAQRHAQKHSQRRASSRVYNAAQQGWQLQAASVVTVLSETLFGASTAWQPPHGSTAAAQQDGGQRDDISTQSRSSNATDELQALVILVEEEWVKEPLWGLPTSSAASWQQEDAPIQQLTPQVLGENALLARVLLEGVGGFARALGTRCRADGRLMYTVLIPVLERMADPCPSVSAAAAAAIGSLCAHGGYSTFDELVRGNADYIVDGLCRQLRHLENHPRAPALFAALLRRAGVAPALLPLLAEPARAAIQGLGILARRRHPEQTAAFLASLQEICAGARTDAQLMELKTKEAAASAEEASKAQMRAYQERGPDHSGSSGRVASAEEIREYFMEHLQAKEESTQNGAESALDPEDLATQVVWDAKAWSAVDDRRRRVHADATLAASAAHMAGPLITSKHLQVALLAMEVSEAALSALAATSAALGCHEQRIEPLVKSRDSVQPVQPETPQLLPVVHSLWAPLLQALKDERIAAVERALGFLGSYTELGGSFLARRFRQEAWPQLCRLLQRGPDTPLSHSEPLAPGVIRRAQLAVVAYLHRMASGKESAAVLAPIAAGAAEAVVPHLAAASPAPLRAAAAQLLLALARLDADAVWLLLFRLSDQEPPANSCPSLLPSMHEILPPQAATSQTAAKDVRQLAGKLLGQVSAITPAWHARAAVQQPACA